MTKLLDRAIEAISALPAEKQDEMAEIMLKLVNLNEPVHHLTPEEAASFATSLAQAERREFASDDDVQAVFSKYAP